MTDVRLLFDKVADDNPVMVNHLGLGAKIVHTPVNEDALVKIGNGSKLNASEARSVQRFVVEPEASAGKRKERSDDNYASDILQGRKQPRNAVQVSFDPSTDVYATC
uniref:Uncharacterized protein n=1 Tax=Phytophthora ramorum TaxID=164328 RepID=H3HAH0_PHYRM